MTAMSSFSLGEAATARDCRARKGTVNAVQVARRINCRRVNRVFMDLWSECELGSVRRDLPDVNVFEPEFIAMVLQLNLAGWEDGLCPVPVVFQRDIVDNKFTVQEHVKLLTHHQDPKTIPFTNRFVG